MTLAGNSAFDIAVVGGGFAGLTAGLRSAERGAKVLILEQGEDERYPCNSRYSGGVFHIAYGDPSRSAEELVAAINAMTKGEAEADIAGAVAAHSARTLEWLRAQGAKFIRGPLDWQRFLTAPPRPLKAGLDWPGYGPDVLLRNLTAKFREKGGTLALGYRAVALTLEGDRCTGLTARGREGGEVEIAAGAVILADGGFQGNADMVQAHIAPRPDLLIQRSAGTGRGDGIRMAQAAGAQLSDMSRFYGHLLSRDGLENDDLWPYPQMDQVAAAAIVIDGSGNRFTDEGLGGIWLANRIAAFEDPTTSFTVFDRTIWEDGPGTKSIYPANPTVEKAGGAVFRADSPEALARLIGVDGAALTRTIEAYNTAVRAGAGSSLTPQRSDGTPPATPIETPPFMAIPLAVGITATMGGVLVDAEMAVRGKGGDPIAGLYAAGGTTGGLEGGGNLGYVGGLSKAVTMGMIAAETATDVVLREVTG
jgi:fumarate reductase flavoprotein subunit